LDDLTDGIDAEVAESLEVRQRYPTDGASALEAFGAEVGAVVGEDLIDEVSGTDGNAGREVTDPESEDFWEA
jgi:hypothetical protein